MAESISQKFTTRSLLKFTLPSVVMMVFIAVYSMLGSVFAANYVGEDALAAINIVFPVASVIIAISVMFSTGSNAIISSELGKGNHQRAREHFTTIVITGAILGFVLTVLSLVFRRQIVMALGAGGELVELAESYLSVYALVFPIMFCQIFSQFFFVTIGKPILGLSIFVVGGTMSILTGYLSMAVFKIGIIGAALGSIVAFAVPGIFFIVYFKVRKDNVLYFVKPVVHKGFIKKVCSNGSSEMVTNLAIAIVTVFLNIIMKHLCGDDGISAVSVIVQVQFLLSSMYIGFGGGVAPIIAFAKGQGNNEQIKNVFHIAKRIVIISSVVLVTLCLVFTDYVVGIFLSEQSFAYAIARNGFTLFSVGYLFVGINIFSSVFFTALSNGKVSALISFLRTFLFIVGMLCILPNIMGVTGVWLSIPIAEMLGFVVVVFILKKYKTTYHY